MNRRCQDLVTVKVFGSEPPCVKCKEVTRRANKVAEKYPGQIQVTKFSALSNNPKGRVPRAEPVGE